ncbi:Hypothetical predicted protein [Mytilus galloprovincialis]|uniref:Uncharacterized protein n=1 Tax=Mytilus galloprovincialis TaxID=29158 RepID=A0A8B6BFT1_MYTGA|nr:Hypothetical predicted protein [Mytilus galloprovincialis]
MGPVSRRPSGQPQYDPALKENWTLLRLRQEVTRLKLKVPKNAKRLTLVRILNSVEDSSHSDNTTETVDISDIADEANTIYGVVQPNTRQEEVAVPTFTSTGSGHSEDINNSGNSHNLESAYASLNRTTIPAAAAGSANQEARSVRTSRGYSAETLPFVETISPQLRKNIISGLDINLASLLIPYYVGSGTSEMFDGDDKNYKTDPRLTRSLSIGEFIQAFSIYKSVMCSAFPHRRSELDIYERDIVDMASRYPVSTPIRINILSKHLIDHPDPDFKQYLIDGLSSGFHTGLLTLPSSSIICKNLKSALSNPSCVSELLQSEVSKGYLLGPFDSIPYTNFRINPIGLAEHKNSKKKRLIVDLSAPHENADHPSLNELIDKEEFSLQYVTIDDAIHLIKKLGSKSWLIKTDITDAFKIMPLKQDLWPFHGIQWDNKFYFFSKDATLTSFGGFYQNHWFQGNFPEDLNLTEESSIAFFELYPIVMACVLWGHYWPRKRILFYCDNLSVVEIITKGRSKVPSIMKLMRKLTFHSAMHNYVVHVRHIPGTQNSIADSISRYQMEKFRKLAPKADQIPTPCLAPAHLMMV